MLTSFAGVMLWSCASEEPFKAENEGTSLVKLNVSMSTSVTRSSGDDPYSNCVIYLSDGVGLIHKWYGVESLPASGIYLPYGSYLAEAFTGDSVPASFQSKYLKGETKFDVSANQLSTQVSILCKIANVVASVDVSKLTPDVAKTIKVEVSSTSGQLIYEGSTLTEKGYFMMPFDNGNNTFEDRLVYTVSGQDLDGTTFSKSGDIQGVVPAHEYKLVLHSDNSVDPIGGASIQIQVQEYELEVDDTVIIHGNPQFSWANNEIEISSQIYNKDKTFTDKTLFIAAFNKFESVVLSTDNETLKNALGGLSHIDLVNSTASDKETLSEKGVVIEDGKNGVYQQFRLTLTEKWLNSLETSPQQYVMDLTAKDDRGMTNSMKIRIATSEEALDAPFAPNTEYNAQNLMSIKTTKAELAVNVYDNVENLSLKYKKEESPEWTILTKSGISGRGTYTFNLSSLEPNTTYQYQFVTGIDGVEANKFESDILTFKTEEEFIIPNASMDQWWLYNNKIWMPNLDAASEFWDTGNHGATAIGDEKDNLTTQFTDFYNTSGSCARLQSKFVGILSIGKLGSGNIFTGKYAGTSGTNGKIDFGREYNGSHPSKLRVWVNYRPAKAVNRKGANDKYIKEGEYDQGQIYIALTDAIKRVDTSDASTLVTEERAPELFLAYGQYTFEGDFGDENKLQMVEIPFTYFERANTIAPKYMIIVCCASKFGDYFSGGDGSVMYVDDFEFVYE